MRTRPLIPVLIAAALCGALPAAASAAVKTKTETATAGAVTAVLTYKVHPKSFDVTGTHLSITRAGVKLLDANVAEPCAQCAVIPVGAFSPGKALRIVDLDGDHEPEVVLDLFTGGAHCCSYTWFYRYTGTGYTGTPAAWGDVGYRIVDLNHDGIPELSSADDRFAYAFTDFADSWFPPQVWRYRAGKLTDVTRSFRRLVSRDAADALRTYRRVGRRRDQRGLVAAYVADEYLLGHGSRGWKLARSALHRGYLKGLGRGDPWPHGARYLKALRRFLRRNGYIT